MWYGQNQARLQGATLDQARAGHQGLPGAAADAGRPRGVPQRPAGENGHSRHARSAAAGHRQGGPPGQGARERAGRDHRVLGFPVPVLPERVSDGEPGAQHVRRSDPFRLSPLPPRQSPAGEAGRRGGAVRRTSRASSGSITIGCSGIRRRSGDADLKQHAAALGLDAAPVQRLLTTRRSTRPTSIRTSARATRPASRARPPSSSTAAC